MTYIKPQVIIHQEFSQPANADESTLRAMIVGPNAILHRYSDADEKAEISLGEYEPGDDSTYLYPERSAGGVVDKVYSKLYVDDALLCYYEKTDQTSLAANAEASIYSVVDYPNVVMSNNINFVSNGTQYPRNTAFGIRDVQVGDYAWVRSYEGEGNSSNPCQYTTHLSKIIGFAPKMTNSSTGTVTPQGITSNVTAVAQNVTATTTITESATAPVLTVTGTFNEILAGKMSYSYTLTVTSVKTSINCAKSVKVSIVSNCGDGSYDEEIFDGVSFNIGSFGLKGSFEKFSGLTVGDKWVITETKAYTLPTLTVSGTYTGDVDDTYIVTFTRGGTPANTDTCPLMTIRTALGLDYVADVRVTSATEAIACGGNGLKFKISGIVATGQSFTFPVTASNNAEVVGLVLQKDLPENMRSTSAKTIALDLRLFKKDNIVLTEDNEVTPASPNFEQEETQVTVNGNIVLNDSDFVTATGTPIALKLFSGNMFFEYREWSPLMVGEINYCDSASALDLIPGQLDADNPMKYAVYKAFANSNGVPVAYTAVANPKDSDEWDSALATIEGTEDVYSITPTSQYVSVLNKVATLIESESGAEQCRWKTGVFCLKLETSRMLVGQNTLNNELFETSTDGKVVKAKFVDNPDESGIQYTRVSVTTGNVKFLDYGVVPGDELRVIINEDEYNSYIVDRVISDESLLVMAGPDVALETAQKIEIWHNMTKTEQAEYYGNLAQSFANRRIMVVAPDKVGEDGKVLPGYFLAAAISGYKSGINAYQGMTRTEISGFDDYSASKPYWNESQLNKLAECGVCIVVEDSNGTPYIRHAITTDMSSTATQEESITRDYDYICKSIHSILQQYVGKVNVTDKVLLDIYNVISLFLERRIESGHINRYSNLSVQRHALLEDRVEVYMTLSLPFPINNIEVYVTAGEEE